MTGRPDSRFTLTARLPGPGPRPGCRGMPVLAAPAAGVLSPFSVPPCRLLGQPADPATARPGPAPAVGRGARERTPGGGQSPPGPARAGGAQAQLPGPSTTGLSRSLRCRWRGLRGQHVAAQSRQASRPGPRGGGGASPGVHGGQRSCSARSHGVQGGLSETPRCRVREPGPTAPSPAEAGSPTALTQPSGAGAGLAGPLQRETGPRR